MNILKSVNVALAKRGMSKRELAAVLDTSPQTLSRLINKGRCSSDDIQRLATVFGMPASEFLRLGED